MSEQNKTVTIGDADSAGVLSLKVKIDAADAFKLSEVAHLTALREAAEICDTTFRLLSRDACNPTAMSSSIGAAECAVQIRRRIKSIEAKQ